MKNVLTRFSFCSLLSSFYSLKFFNCIETSFKCSRFRVRHNAATIGLRKQEKLGASQIAKNVIFHFDILAFLGIFTDPYFFCKSYIITNLKNNDDITNWLLLLSRIK